MPRYRVLPYKPGSKSAKTLATALDGLRLKVRGSKFRPRYGDVIINWGSQVLPERLRGFPILNHPSKINIVSNKLAFFRAMHEDSDTSVVPDFWERKENIPADAYPIVCRTILSGHSGAGIVIANNADELVDAPLYVKYIKKEQEYRVHVAGGRKIAVQRKARLRSVPDAEVNWLVRNHSNGFVFARNGFVTPEQVVDVAIRAVVASGLDFGAADVVFNGDQQRAYVLEINTAPGLEGSTINDYVNYFQGRDADANDDNESDSESEDGD
jgi:glutathione synthase/RimK-type ligase-like ATP-grasp enzyme